MRQTTRRLATTAVALSLLLAGSAALAGQGFRGGREGAPGRGLRATLASARPDRRPGSEGEGAPGEREGRSTRLSARRGEPPARRSGRPRSPRPPTRPPSGPPSCASTLTGRRCGPKGSRPGRSSRRSSLPSSGRSWKGSVKDGGTLRGAGFGREPPPRSNRWPG